MKLDLLTNATVVDESIKFVEEKSRDERCIIKKEAAVGLKILLGELHELCILIEDSLYHLRSMM